MQREGRGPTEDLPVYESYRYHPEDNRLRILPNLAYSTPSEAAYRISSVGATEKLSTLISVLVYLPQDSKVPEGIRVRTYTYTTCKARRTGLCAKEWHGCTSPEQRGAGQPDLANQKPTFCSQPILISFIER